MTTPPDACLSVNGETYPLRLTLGALASLEESLGEGKIGNLTKRLADPSVSDLLILLQALLAGGGAGLTLATLKAADIDFVEAAAAIARCFAGLGAASEDAPGKPAGETPTLSRSPSTTGSGEASS